MNFACVLIVLVSLVVMQTSAYQPICKQPTKCSPPCTYVYKPVCGKNGCTYSNMCLLVCAGAIPHYNGVCRQPWPPRPTYY